MRAPLSGAALLRSLPSVQEAESAYRGLLPRPHSTLYSRKQLVRPGLRLLPAGRLGSRLEVGLGLFLRLYSEWSGLCKAAATSWTHLHTKCS